MRLNFISVIARLRAPSRRDPLSFGIRNADDRARHSVRAGPRERLKRTAAPTSEQNNSGSESGSGISITVAVNN